MMLLANNYADTFQYVKVMYIILLSLLYIYTVQCVWHWCVQVCLPGWKCTRICHCMFGTHWKMYPTYSNSL